MQPMSSACGAYIALEWKINPKLWKNDPGIYLVVYIPR
jgi:hypothetical protein